MAEPGANCDRGGAAVVSQQLPPSCRSPEHFLELERDVAGRKDNADVNGYKQCDCWEGGGGGERDIDFLNSINGSQNSKPTLKFTIFTRGLEVID